MTNSRTSSHKLLLLAGSIGPLGHLPASGTITVAVVGIPLFWLLQHVSTAIQVLIVIVFSLAAVWLHQVADRLLGEKDSRKMVWDEIAGFLTAVIAVPFIWQLVVAAFLIERTLDIVKFPPANWIERKWPGGWGVVGDDIVAGLYTLGLLHLGMRLAPRFLGL